MYDVKLTDKAGNETTVQKYIYVTDGLIAEYDGENNTGSGHDSTATTWKDLSNNNQDLEVHGATWNSDYLTFDGINDYAKTASAVKLNNSKQITIELVDVNGELFTNQSNAIIFETSENWNKNPTAFGLDTNEYGSKDLAVTFFKGQGYNIKKTESNILQNGKTAIYTITINTQDEHSNFIQIYKNSELIQTTYVQSHNVDLSNINLQDYILYLGCRGGNSNFTKMKLGTMRIYNRELSKEEIATNYEIDRYRFNITN